MVHSPTPVGSNQTEVDFNGQTIFFSYKTPVAIFIPGRGAICTKQKFSRTTSKHITQAVSRWGCNRWNVEAEEFKRALEQTGF